MKFLVNEQDVANIPIGYTWESPLMRAGFFRTILFALLTGDWNKIHVNPVTFFFYKSNLGGMTCPGDMVLSLTKRGVHKMFRFEKDVEVITSGYDSVKFKRPLRVGSLFRYRYVLISSGVTDGISRCKWRIEIIDKKKKIISVAIWANWYYPVERTTLGKILIPTFVAGETLVRYTTAIAFIILSIGGWFFYHPFNEFNFPIAP